MGLSGVRPRRLDEAAVGGDHDQVAAAVCADVPDEHVHRGQVVTGMLKKPWTSGGCRSSAITRSADVPVDTVYKAFGGKAGLVRVIWDQGLAGSGSIPAWQRSDEMRSLEADPRKVIDNWGTLAPEVAPRRCTHPSPHPNRSRHRSPSSRRCSKKWIRHASPVIENNARELYDRGHLREGVTLELA